MAGRRQDLETRLIAKDDASKVIDKVADELDSLEKRDTTIDLVAEDKATAEVKSLSQLLTALSDEDKTVVLNAKVSDAERNIDRILRSLRDVDKMDQQEIDVRVEMLGDARAELDRVQDELRQIDSTSVDATVDIETRGLDDLTGAMDMLPGQLGDITGALGAGGSIVGGVTAIAGGLLAAANSAADMAVSARTMSELTGDSVEDVSRLQAVWETTGADVNDLNDIVLQMVGVLQSTPDLAGQLGVNLEDGATGGQRFVQVMEKLRDFTGDASDKAVLMSQLLGEEGARQGAKLLAVVDDIGASMADVPEGAIITDGDVDTALDMQQAINEVNAEFKALAVEIGQSIIPLVTDLVDLLQTAKTPEYLRHVSAETGKATGYFEQAKRSLDALVTRDIKATVAEDLGEIAEVAASTAENIGLIGPAADEARAGLEAGRYAAFNQVQAEIAENIKSAVEELQTFAEEAVRVQDVLKDLDKGAIRVDAFATAWEELGDSTLGAKANLADLVEANRNLIDGFRDAEGNIRLARTSLDEMRESGRENIAAADALRQAYGTDLARALEDTGGNYHKVRERARFWRQELEGQLEALGLSTEQIDEYVTALGLTPEQVTTTIQLSRQEEAMQQLEALNVELDDIDNRAVQAEIATAIKMGDYVGARDAVVAYYDDNPATLPVKPVVVYGGYSYLTGGGAGAGTLAAPAGLSATPMAAGVSPMAGPTLPTLMLPVAAPAQQQQPIVINNVLNAAVVGDPYAVARAMEDGTRRAARLMPRNQ